MTTENTTPHALYAGVLAEGDKRGTLIVSDIRKLSVGHSVFVFHPITPSLGVWVRSSTAEAINGGADIDVLLAAERQKMIEERQVYAKELDSLHSQLERARAEVAVLEKQVVEWRSRVYDAKDELRAAGHVWQHNDRTLADLVDMAIDKERTRHDASLEKISKALGQEWMLHHPDRGSFEAWAAALVERIRHDWRRKPDDEAPAEPAAPMAKPDIQAPIVLGKMLLSVWVEGGQLRVGADVAADGN